MKYRKLRIAWSVVCGSTAVLVAGLWLRSLKHNDSVVYRFEQKAVAANSCNGRLYLVLVPYWKSLPWDEEDGRLRVRHWTVSDKWIEQVQNPSTIALGFGVVNNSAEYGFVIPYWASGLLAGLFAAIPWRVKSWRFSLRAVLIAMTLAAVALGLIALIAAI